MIDRYSFIIIVFDLFFEKILVMLLKGMVRKIMVFGKRSKR